MARFFKKGRGRTRELPGIPAFESRTEVWHEVGLGAEIDKVDAKRARREALRPAARDRRRDRRVRLPRHALPRRREDRALRHRRGARAARLGPRPDHRAGLAPILMRRMEPGTAGTAGFLIRLVTMLLVIIAALRIAGVKPETLAVGGAFTAVVLGLAAQQTLAHVFAGLVLLDDPPVPASATGSSSAAARWPARSRASSAPSGSSTRR